MRLHLLPHDAIENVFSRLSTTDVIATASASPFLTLALATILQHSHLVLDKTTKQHLLSCPKNVASHIRHLSISAPMLPEELIRLTNVFTALHDVSLNISTRLPSHVWFQFLSTLAPSLTRCAVQFCADLPGHLVLQALAPNCPNLQHLTLRFTPHVYALDIQPLLITAGHSLRVLRLEDCLGVDDQLVIAIANFCNNLESLSLGGSEHVGDDAILAITQSPCAKTLTTLDIRSCMQVTDEGVFAIATSCYALKTLNLWAVCVTSYGVRAVAEGLGVELETLIIGDCIGVDDTAVQSIADNCDALVTLEMCGLKRITDDGIMALFDTNRTGRLQLHNLTIDRCMNVTSRGVLAATGLLHDTRTTSCPCESQTCVATTPFRSNKHPDITKRKQSHDRIETNNTTCENEGEDCGISKSQHISQQCKTDMLEFCNEDSSQMICYVSHLRKLSAVATNAGPGVWKMIRECRKGLDLVADDCEIGNDDVRDVCRDYESSDSLNGRCVDGGVVVGEKWDGLEVYRTNRETNIRGERIPQHAIHILGK